MTGDRQSGLVTAWWVALGVVAVFNMAMWLFTARVVLHERRIGARGLPHEMGGVDPWPTRQLLLCALFVVGCAFRSLLPRSEGQRICLYDAWMSSAVLGRIVATVAELALVAQFTLVVRQAARAAHSRYANVVAWSLLPLIAVAEVCSWYTTLTTNFMGSVIEETIWAATAALMISAFLITRRRVARAGRMFINLAIALSTAYIIFMTTIDVPMYWRRWKGDHAAHKASLPVAAGWQDAITRRVVTRRWEDWREEIPWMSLYFSVGVWISLSLVRSPRLEGVGPQCVPS
jgi:hypothetical protein